MVADGKYAEDAKQAGADIIGLDDLINEIKQGKIDFDVAITTPRYLPKLASVARVVFFCVFLTSRFWALKSLCLLQRMEPLPPTSQLQ